MIRVFCEFAIRNLNPRPLAKHVVLNNKIWGALDEATICMVSPARAKSDTGMELIWKTTSFPRPKSKQALSDKVLQADALMSDMCEKLGAYLNLSWTRHVAAELFTLVL